MVLFVSLVLVIIAVVLLVLGIFFQAGLVLTYASIVVVVASGAVLGTGVFLQRRAETQATRDDGPDQIAEAGTADPVPPT